MPSSWGSLHEAAIPEARAWQLCQQYIERGVAGVFFAPLEYAKLLPAPPTTLRQPTRQLGDAAIAARRARRPASRAEKNF